MKMKKYTLYILLYSIALTGMTACINDRYPSISEIVPDPIEVNNDEKEAKEVPIYPTFANPSFNLVTRGTGVFEDWESDQAHWMSAPFHIYAYWADPAGADYTKSAMPQCLLRGDTLRLVDAQGNVKFCRDTLFVDRFYPEAYPRNKYKFYTFFCDSLIPTIHESRTGITADLALDGSSDLIHSYAYHPDSVLDATLLSLPVYDDVFELLKSEGQNLLYSTVAGSRNINPLFHLNHMLCRFDIYIQGAEGLNTDYSFLNMIIDEITMEAPKKVSLKVADNSWTEQTYKAELEANSLLTYQDTIAYQPDMFHSQIANTPYNQQKLGYDYNQIRQDWEQLMGAQDTAYFHVGGTTEKKLCKTLLLPPMTTYHLTMKGRALNIDANGKLTMNKDGKYYRDVVSESEMGLKENGLPVSFKAGTKYTLTIYVYSDGGLLSATVTGIDDKQWSDEYTFDNIHD